MNLLRRGFSLPELLVVIAIIGLVASVGYVQYNEGRKQARDDFRKTQIDQLAIALRLYYEAYGQYPDKGCAAGYYTGFEGWASATVNPNAHGAVSDFVEENCPTYIPGLSPQFVSKLPIEQLDNNPGEFGYAYVVDASRQNYKIAVTPVEAVFITSDGEKFSRCPANRAACPASTECGAPANSGTVWPNAYFVSSKGEAECW